MKPDASISLDGRESDTLPANALGGFAIGVAGCDNDLGAAIALHLADYGAQLHLIGADAARLQNLRSAITAHWGRATIDTSRQAELGAPDLAEAIRSFLRPVNTSTIAQDKPDKPQKLQLNCMVHACLSGHDAIQFLRGDLGEQPQAPTILVVPQCDANMRAALEQTTAQKGDCGIFVLLLNHPTQHARNMRALTMLTAVLVSPAGLLLGSQCFTAEALADANISVTQLYPAMTVCAPSAVRRVLH